MGFKVMRETLVCLALLLGHVHHMNIITGARRQWSKFIEAQRVNKALLH